MITISYEFRREDSTITFTFLADSQQLSISYASDVELGSFVNKLIELMEKEDKIDIRCTTSDSNKNAKEQIISETIEGIGQKFNQVIEDARKND